MKQWKKITSMLIVFTFLIGIMGSNLSATTQLNKANEDVFSGEQLEFADIVMSNLENYTDSDGNPQIKITDKISLQDQLNTNSSNIISFEELESTISDFNYYMSAGENALTELAEEFKNSLQQNNGIQPMALTCSDILGIIGLIHSGNYALAAMLLGVTGPAAFLVPFLIATAYTAGSVLGCRYG